MWQKKQNSLFWESGSHSRDPQISFAIKVAESVGGVIYFTQPQAPNFRNIQAGVTCPTSARTKGEKVALTLHRPSQVKIASFKEQHEEAGWDLENSRIWGGRQGKKSHPFASKLPQKCGQAKNIPGCHRQPISPQVFCIACFLGIFQRNLRIYNLSQRDVLCSPM